MLVYRVEMCPARMERKQFLEKEKQPPVAG